MEPAGCPDDAFEAALLLHSLRLTLTFSLSLHVPKTAQHRFIPPGFAKNCLPEAATLEEAERQHCLD